MPRPGWSIGGCAGRRRGAHRRQRRRQPALSWPPAEALRLAARARRVFHRLGEELRSAVLDEIVGLVYFQQDDYTRALRLFDRARPVSPRSAGRSTWRR